MADRHDESDPAGRLHLAVGIVMEQLGLDVLSGYGWIVATAHETGESIHHVIAGVIDRWRNDDGPRDPGGTGDGA